MHNYRSVEVPLSFATAVLTLLLGQGCGGALEVGDDRETTSALATLTANTNPGLFGIDAVFGDSAAQTHAQAREPLATGMWRTRYRHKADTAYDANLLSLRSDITALRSVGVRTNMQINHESLHDASAWRSCGRGDDGCWRSYIASFAAQTERLTDALTDAPGTYILWNEQDFDATRIPPERYAQLFAAACPRIKLHAPGVQVQTGGFALPPNTIYSPKGRWDYFEQFWAALVKTGQQSCLNVINFHVYVDLPMDRHAKIYAWDCISVKAAGYPNCADQDIAHTVDALWTRSGMRASMIFGMDEWGVRNYAGLSGADFDRITAAQITGYFQRIIAGIPRVHEAALYSWSDPASGLVLLKNMPASRAAFLSNAAKTASVPAGF